MQRDLRPAMTVSGHPGRDPRAEDGHYYVHLAINGQKIIFLADTGASGIVLSPADARSLGIDPEGPDLSRQRQHRQRRGAHGTGHPAAYRAGPFKDENLQALSTRLPWTVPCSAWITSAASTSRSLRAS